MMIKQNDKHNIAREKEKLNILIKNKLINQNMFNL